MPDPWLREPRLLLLLLGPLDRLYGLKGPPPLKRALTPLMPLGLKAQALAPTTPSGLPVLTLGFFRLRWLKNCLCRAFSMPGGLSLLA